MNHSVVLPVVRCQANVTGWLVNHVADEVLNEEWPMLGKPFKSMDWDVPKFELEGWLGLDVQRNVMSSFPRSNGGFFSQVTHLLLGGFFKHDSSLAMALGISQTLWIEL